jgi:hypothetical protein
MILFFLYVLFFWCITSWMCLKIRNHKYGTSLQDFWTLDLKTNQWEQILAKGCPSARSGHRMVSVLMSELLVNCYGPFCLNLLHYEH